MVVTATQRKGAAEAGARLGRMRRGKNLTQAELAAQAEVSADTVNKLERGWTQPHPGTVRKLAAALGVSVEGITGGVG